MNCLIIIPSRYGSTRFEGKPLCNIHGKSLVQRTYEQANKVTTNKKVIVATDDERIFNHVIGFGGDVEYTSSDHQSGTDRCFELAEKTNFDWDILINIQGDEPFIQNNQILDLINSFENPQVEISTLIKKIDSQHELFNENSVKVVKSQENKALYFSRSPIPFYRGEEQSIWIQKHQYFKHIGVYAFRKTCIEKIKNIEHSILDKVESLEQLKWLENGLNIYTVETNFQSPAVDTPDDLKKIDEFLLKHPELV